MSNRTYLVAHQGSGFAEKYDADTEILAGASYCVPLFWLSLFTHESLVRVRTEVENADGATVVAEVPHLVVAAAAGRRMTEERMDGLLSILPAAASSSALEWKALCGTLQDETLQVDCSELWMMDPDGFGQALRKALAALDEPKGLGLAPLSELVGLAIDQPLIKLACDLAEDLPLHLRGYAWVRKVPFDAGA